jgi:hypothetical protein
MTETTEGTTPGVQDGQNNAAPNENGKPKGEDTVEIRKGELQGYKTQLREMKKALEEFTAQRSAEEAEKLKASQNWEALEKKKTAEIDAMKQELIATKRAALSAQARSALLEAGMSAGLIVDGALSKMPTDIESDAIAAWVDALKVAHPAEFSRPVNPIGSPSVGATGRPTTDDASALKAKVAATRGKGPAAMEAVMREVAAYAAAHNGKNPLA